jgi:hypothetical protein
MLLKHFYGQDLEWHNLNQQKTALISIPAGMGWENDEEAASQGPLRADWQLWLYLRTARLCRQTAGVSDLIDFPNRSLPPEFIVLPPMNI